MKNILIFLFIGLCTSSCETDSKEKVKKSIDVLVIKYDDQGNEYSLHFTKSDSLMLTSSKINGNIFITDKLIKAKVDSFITMIKEQKSDSIFFLPHLQTGGIYSVSFPLDTILNSSFRYGDNNRRVYYDFVKWVDSIKANFYKN